MLFEHFREAFGSGILYPRWLPEIHGGYGYPTFVLYQPGYFFWKLPFSALISDPLWAAYASLYGLFVIGAAGAWLLGRTQTNELGGYIAATAFTLTPYAFVNLYVRCDLSELAALLIAPWPFALTLMLRQRLGADHRSGLPLCLALIVALTALIYSHPVGLVFVMPIYAAFIVCLGFGRGSAIRLRFWLSAACAVTVALAFSAPYWVTLIEMMPHVNIKAAFRNYYVPERHFVDFTDYILPRIGREGPVFAQLGMPHLVVAVLGAFALRRNLAALFGIVALAVLLVAMSDFAAAFWTLPVVRNMQFPWRMMCVVATLMGLCASGSVRLLPACTAGKWLVLGIVYCGSLAWYQTQFEFKAGATKVSREFLTARRAEHAGTIWAYVAKDEFRPRWASRHHALRKPNEPMMVATPTARLAVLPTSTKWRPYYQVTASGPVSITIRQFYLPGWRVEIDGTPVADAVLRRLVNPADGTMRVTVPPGAHRIMAWYEGPPGWWRRNLAMLLITLVCMLLLAYLDWRAAGGTRSNSGRVTLSGGWKAPSAGSSLISRRASAVIGLGRWLRKVVMLRN